MSSHEGDAHALPMRNSTQNNNPLLLKTILALILGIVISGLTSPIIGIILGALVFMRSKKKQSSNNQRNSSSDYSQDPSLLSIHSSTNPGPTSGHPSFKDPLGESSETQNQQRALTILLLGILFSLAAFIYLYQKELLQLIERNVQ